MSDIITEKQTIKHGQIWEYKNKNGGQALVLILGAFDNSRYLIIPLGHSDETGFMYGCINCSIEIPDKNGKDVSYYAMLIE